MNWLRNWFCGGRALPARRAHAVRPALEQLEDRRTPSIAGAVSSVTDNMGNSVMVEVHTDGTLWAQQNGGPLIQPYAEQNVTSVSAGTDINGQAGAFVVDSGGRLTLQNTQSLFNNYGFTSTVLAQSGVKSVVAEGNGRALVIDTNGFLWQYDPKNSWSKPVDSNGNPEFQGQPSLVPWCWGLTCQAPNFSLLDANVTQATPLTAHGLAGSFPTVVALHTDGTLTSDTLQVINLPDGQTGYNVLHPAILTPNLTSVAGIVSISSVTMPGSPYANYLYTVSSNGDLQKNELSVGDILITDADYGNAGGAGFKDVNVGWNSGDWVATTNTYRVYRDGQLMDGGDVYSAYAGPGGSFYEVSGWSGYLIQWSPQAHSETWSWGDWGSYTFMTNWTILDSNVSPT
jgi:hypothetical protein